MEDAKRPNKKLQHERELRGWSQAFIAEKIGTVEKTVSRWECGEQKPGPTYRRRLCKLFGKDAVELGFLEEDKEEQQQELPTNPSSTSYTDLNILSQQNNFTPILVLGSELDRALSQFTTSQSSTLLLLPQTAEIGLDAMDRRGFLSGSLKVAGATFVASQSSSLEMELLERFQRALKKPSTVDERFLNYLEINTARFWHDRHGAVLASSDLFSYVAEHFEKILTLLERPMPPSIRTRLCSLASKSALLIGELLLDMSHYARARDFQKSALMAAQETGNQALAAISWGRLSLAWIYSKDSANALACVQTARSLAANNSTTLVQAWLAAIEAEAQVNLHHWNACLKALDEAEHIEGGQTSMEDSYLIHFDQALLGGYQGVCFRKLYRPDIPQSTLYLEKAQSVLTSSLEQLNLTLIQRKPTFLADLADISLQQGEIEQACEQACQAASIAANINLQKVMKRLFSLRKDLEPWKDTPYVKSLDNHLTSLVESTG